MINGRACIRQETIFFANNHISQKQHSFDWSETYRVRITHEKFIVNYSIAS